MQQTMVEEKREDSGDGSFVPTRHLEALWTVNQRQIMSHTSIFHQVTSPVLPGQHSGGNGPR